jgi:hypothetical protein
MKVKDLSGWPPSNFGSKGIGSTIPTHAQQVTIYTNDRAKLPEALGHDVSHESAHTPAIKPEQSIKPPQPEIAPVIEHGMGLGHSL